MQARTDAISHAFGVAENYDAHAAVQRRVAETLTLRIAGLPLPPSPRVCEIGCGTGFLSAALARHIGAGDWLVTDLCPAMVARAQARLPEGRFRFAVVDAERPQPLAAEAPFDLICSSLAAQWFSDLEGTLQRLFRHLRPGGHLAFTTLVAGTFAEWRHAHTDANLSPGTPDYPPLQALRDLRLDGVAGDVDSESFTQSHTDGMGFLTSLKGIGARTPIASHTPLRPSELRAVLRRFEQNGARASYLVATCIFTKPAG